MSAKTAPRRQLFAVWIDHPSSDWVLVGLFCGGLWWFDLARYLPASDRATLYSVLISIAVALLGLGTVTLTLIVTGTPSDKLRAAITTAGKDLIALIFSCLFGFLLSTTLYVLLYFLPTESQGQAHFVFAASSVLLALRSVRLMWLFRRILDLLV